MRLCGWERDLETDEQEFSKPTRPVAQVCFQRALRHGHEEPDLEDEKGQRPRYGDTHDEQNRRPESADPIQRM